MQHRIRLVTPDDSAAILAIYEPYIRNTAISFETEVPSLDEFAARVEGIAARYPFLVCEASGAIVGYAYASRHRERAAYRFDVDVSIYVAPEHHGTGVARALYGRLFVFLKELGYVNAYAGITVPNDKSMGFHRKFCFAPIGIYHNTGYKFGRWHDVAWLEKTIRERGEHPGEVKGIGELSSGYLTSVFSLCGGDYAGKDAGNGVSRIL